MKARCLDIIIKSIRKMLPIYCVGHKDGIFFRSNNMIETYCFFFGSFISLEQINDYVMILEYQGEIIMQNVVLRHMTFCLELWKAKCAIFCLISCS